MNSISLCCASDQLEPPCLEGLYSIRNIGLPLPVFRFLLLALHQIDFLHICSFGRVVGTSVLSVGCVGCVVAPQIALQLT